MASAPEPVRGRVDPSGRLMTADPRLARLQEEAGGGLGRTLAVPQLADIARLASQLGITLSRAALAATRDADLDLWVRAEPTNDGVDLSIESWVERPPRARRFQLVQNDAPPVRAADVTTDPELKVTSLGAETAGLLGVLAKDAKDQPLTRLVALLPDEEGDLPLLAAVAARQAFSGQVATARASKAELTISGEPRFDAHNAFLGFAMTFSSASEPVAREEAETQSFDALLREPLDAIVGEAERIADKAEGPLRSDYAAYASDIAGAARHLLEVLQAMGRESLPPAAERIDLAALALEAAGLVQPQANEAGVVLEVEGATALPAYGEARSVTQILVNLIGNAIRYSPRGASVRIVAELAGDAQVTVADQGRGVTPADQERIFERFEQAEPRESGAGLGLAISRRLARQMGGDIMLDSAPGEGARFTLRLPLA